MFSSPTNRLKPYPAGGYTLKVWKDLSISFAGGFGAVYLRATKDGYDTHGNKIVASGNHWDLAAHASVKLSYKLGPILLQAIPVHCDILIGVGDINPAPLAPFAFLVGVGYDF